MSDQIGMPPTEPVPPSTPQAEIPTGPTPAVASTRGLSRTIITAAIAGTVGVLLGIGGTLGVQNLADLGGDGDEGSRLDAALVTCGIDDTTNTGDGGYSVELDMMGKDDAYGISYSEMECTLRELDVPDSVWAEMGRTRALDGRQTGSWDDIEASWTYHPDSGLDVILTLERD